MADLFLGRPRSRRYPKFNIRRDIPLENASPNGAPVHFPTGGGPRGGLIGCLAHVLDASGHTGPRAARRIASRGDPLFPDPLREPWRRAQSLFGNGDSGPRAREQLAPRLSDSDHSHFRSCRATSVDSQRRGRALPRSCRLPGRRVIGACRRRMGVDQDRVSNPGGAKDLALLLGSHDARLGSAVEGVPAPFRSDASLELSALDRRDWA